MPRTLPAVALLLFAASTFAQQAPLQTAAEATKYGKTSTSAEVVAFAQELAKRSPLAKYSTYGKTPEGRPLPLLVLSDPPVATPEEAVAAKKSVVMVTANIHAGEVDGKEAVLMLARDLVNEKDSPLLKKLVMVIAPNYNPDGNDKFGEWRKTQNGPREVGTRANAAGFDLPKLFAGSFGTLGAIVQATFKVQPMPAVDVTIVHPCPNVQGAAELGLSLSRTRALDAAVALDP
ncbi:MAG: M14 family zinc carboxypeptidase, partial [Gemmataceae bacterium]